MVASVRRVLRCCRAHPLGSGRAMTLPASTRWTASWCGCRDPEGAEAVLAGRAVLARPLGPRPPPRQRVHRRV